MNPRPLRPERSLLLRISRTFGCCLPKSLSSSIPPPEVQKNYSRPTLYPPPLFGLRRVTLGKGARVLYFLSPPSAPRLDEHAVKQKAREQAKVRKPFTHTCVNGFLSFATLGALCEKNSPLQDAICDPRSGAQEASCLCAYLVSALSLFALLINSSYAFFCLSPSEFSSDR